MAKLNIPQRASNEKDFSQLSALDKKIIAYAVLCQTTNEEAFMRFHPEYIRPDGKGMNDSGRQDSKLFWNYGKNREYRQAYETTLQEFLDGKQTDAAGAEGAIDDARIECALKKLLSQTIGLLDRGDSLDPDSVKTIVEVFRKMNLLKDDVEKEIRPLRFLPERCSSCRYRIGVESAVLNGEMIDMCQCCKARKIAEANGYRFNDGKDLLEIPENVLADLAAKNDVNTLDIINGKIVN